MAQRDLHIILTQIADELKSTFRANVDTFPHILQISAAHVEEHLLLQLTEIVQPDRRPKTHVLSTRYNKLKNREEAEAALLSEPDKFLATRTESQANKIRALVKDLSKEYARRVYEELRAKSKNYTLEKTGSDTEYSLKVTYVGPQVTLNTAKPEFLQKNPADVFRHIRDSGLAPARDYVRRSLSTQLKGLLPSTFTKETIFDLGHITAVSTVKISRAMSKLNQLRATKTFSKILEDSLEFQMMSKYSKLGDPEVEREFETQVAYARPEAATFNNWQSNYEASLLREVQNALNEVLTKNIDWADQPGSDSVIDVISKGLLLAAKKHGATVTGNTKIDAKTNRANLKVRKRRKEVTTVVDGNETIDVPNMENLSSMGGTGVNIDLRSLIPELNRRLPEIVRSHMGMSGRLVNRTGRFSESAQIIDIGENSVISYTYQRNPYGVFEHQGPRDPRPLIEMSVRELARGLINQRFALRRI